ncbi:hypothetical protein OTU49_002666 [Cherax quadricarinatus]|uniref:Uncharacterized protein n=1 Tax=Cherax quadricarinatus TaxID=27406 RepID=A0AAW0XM22_CHEQU
MMTLQVLQEGLSLQVTDIVSAQDDWTSDDRQNIQRQYMEIHSELWGEVVSIAAQEDHQCSEDTQEDPDVLEDVEIRHEGTLIAVTKKRKEYPALLTGLLGKKTRLQNNTVEKLKVDLPPRAPLEVNEGMSHLDGSLDPLFKSILVLLSENMHNIQLQTNRLTHVADAAEIIINNQHHPIETLVSNIERYIKDSNIK